MTKQKTIGNSFQLRSKGLHTGLDITATVKPAPENTGIRICRIDLEGQPCYEALADYVGDTTRGTVLECGIWKVSTVEHLLSALYACGITNALIEVNAPEIPILDGSAKYWIEAIHKVGVVEQEAESKTLIITEPVVYEDEKIGTRLEILPAEHYELEVKIDFNSSVLGTQVATYNAQTNYQTEIANARTFCFLREIRPLLQMGLIKGGDLQNALVIYDQPMAQAEFDAMADALGQPHQDADKLGYLSSLKYDNEPARHKLLDLIGDLSLTGYRIQGKVIAYRPGHGSNTKFAKCLREKK